MCYCVKRSRKLTEQENRFLLTNATSHSGLIIEIMNSEGISGLFYKFHYNSILGWRVREGNIIKTLLRCFCLAINTGQFSLCSWKEMEGKTCPAEQSIEHRGQKKPPMMTIIANSSWVFRREWGPYFKHLLWINLLTGVCSWILRWRRKCQRWFQVASYRL